MAGFFVALLVVPTLAVTLARMLPGGGLMWVVLRACTPVAILSYTLAIMILVAMSWGLRGTGRSFTLSVLAVVTSLLALHVWWFVEPFLVDAPGSATDHAFVVMTANLHFGQARPDAVIDAVDRYGVNVLILEEVTPSALAKLDSAGLDRRLDHRIGSPRPGRNGIMLFTSEPLGNFTELGTSSPGFGVDVTTSQGPLRVFAVHPIAPNNGVARWSKDLEVIVAAARSSRGPTVVAGDFNATLDHPHLHDLMDSSYRDASADAGLGWRPTWPSPNNVRLFGVGVPSVFALDHVFVHGPLEARQAQTCVISETDHRALVTRISWTDSLERTRG